MFLESISNEPFQSTRIIKLSPYLNIALFYVITSNGVIHVIDNVILPSPDYKTPIEGDVTVSDRKNP